MKILAFDTETTGLPDYKVPSEAEHQPHIVQIAAQLFDLQGRAIYSMDMIVKPAGWIITAENAAIHGITMERAMDEGMNEADALDEFMALVHQAHQRTAYNTTFDNRIIRIAQARYFPKNEAHEEIMRSWKEDKDQYLCTMIEARKVIGRQVKLEEAYLYFTGSVLEGAHNAWNDTMACKTLYLKMLEQGYIKPQTTKEGELLC
jgi:DNA polymerase-3 subunit epsilon